MAEGLNERDTADRLVDDVPDLLALEAHRLARGWSRSELSTQIDALYLRDGLAPPKLTDSELCRWEHGDRRPNEERIEYLCQVYETRPDKLGFGKDFGAVDIGHLAGAGIADIWPRTTPETFDDLTERIEDAEREITVFGLTRNFYAKDHTLPLFEEKAKHIPVTFYVMDPWCGSRRERYRIEPTDAAMEDPERYVREVLRPLHLASQRTVAEDPAAGMRLYTYNFPCSFAMEKTDSTCRVMLYGHGKRGTDGPMFVFNEGTPYWDYFNEQLGWLNRLATDPRPPWTDKGIIVRPLTNDVLTGPENS